MTSADPRAARAALLRDGNFRWLVGGGAISLLGDQFTLIALPWLVLQMTGDTAVLGTVLLLIGVPRAVFILVGGAVVDRHSPKTVLMLTKHVSTVLLAVLAAGVFAGGLPLPAVYACALGLGLASAFSIPSGTSMLPHVVPREQLAAANGMMMGMRQLSMFLGPLLGGGLIALFGGGVRGDVAGATGIAVALGLDALSFAVSAWTLAQVRTQPRGPAPVSSGVWRSVAEGLRHVGRDVELRTAYLYWAAVAVLVMGPLHIAVPVLAASRADLGAGALGLMSGAHGAGTLLGMVASGLLPRLRIGTLGTTVLVADVVIGLLFMPMAFIGAGWQGAALMLLTGLLGGFMQVAIFTWIQSRVHGPMLGRAMSLFMFIFMGLVPLSSAATGWLLRHLSLEQVFMGSGGLLAVAALIAWVVSPMRRVDDAVRSAAVR